MEECMDLLLKYRKIVCRIWNEAFWPNPDLKGGDLAQILCANLKGLGRNAQRQYRGEHVHDPSLPSFT